MKLSRLTTLGLAGVLMSGPALARAADEPARARQATDAEQLRQLQDQIKALQAQMQKLLDDKAARDKANTTPPVKAGGPNDKPPPTNPPSTGGAGLKITGDTVSGEADIESEKSREIGILPPGDQGLLRGRFRIRFQAPITQRSDAEIFLGTAQNVSPTTAYVSFSDAFRGKNISFTRAFFNYYFGNKNNPKTPSLVFGKMQNPFWRGELGGFASEIFWDNDVNPEGVAVRLPIVNTPKFSLNNASGYFTLNLPSKNLLTGLTTDTYQIGTQFKLDSGFFHGAFSYYVFDNLNSGLLAAEVTPDGFIDLAPGTSAFLLQPGTGLQSTNGHYFFGSTEAGFGANTFNIINLSLQAAPKVKPNHIQPFLHYEYLHNSSVPVLNDGFGITLGINKSRLADGNATSRGDYTAWFTYRDVDADAALGTLADSDLGQGTDYRGFQFVGFYRIQDNLAFRAAWQDYKGFPIKTNHVTRLFLDFIRSF